MLRIAFILLIGASAAFAGEPQYYVTVWSYQSRIGNRPRLSHSFARFVKVIDGRVVDAADISWLPDGQDRSSSCELPAGVQDGFNYSLQQTFDIANRCHLRTSTPSGPYPIAPWVFQSAKDQESDLDAGKIAYRMRDNRENPSIQNCIAAIAWVVGKKKTYFKRGPTATPSLIDFYAETGAITYLQPQPWLLNQVLNYQPPPKRPRHPQGVPLPHRHPTAPLAGRAVFGRTHN